MIGIIAVLRVKEGCEAAFEEGFKALAAEVRAQEPGALVYQLVKSRSEKNLYKVLELYADDEAIKRHGETDHMKKARSGVFASTLAGRSEIEILDAVV